MAIPLVCSRTLRNNSIQGVLTLTLLKAGTSHYCRCHSRIVIRLQASTPCGINQKGFCRKSYELLKFRLINSFEDCFWIFEGFAKYKHDLYNFWEECILISSLTAFYLLPSDACYLTLLIVAIWHAYCFAGCLQSFHGMATNLNLK